MEETVLCLADAHGNLPALEKALAVGREYGAARVLALGDMVGELPFSRQVMLRLLEENAVFIRGNRERDLVDFPKDWVGATQFACLQAAREELGELVRLMEPWPITRELPGMTISHGTPENIYEIMQRGTARVRTLLEKNPQPLMLVGHDHLQWSFSQNGKTAAAVGSTGLAHDLGHGRAHFALIRQGKVHFMSAGYDTQELRKKAPEWIERCGPMARAAVQEALYGNYAILDLVRYAQQMAQWELSEVPKVLPNALFCRAAEKFFS